MKKYFFIVCILLTAVLFFNSCRKGNENEDTDVSHVVRNNNFEVVSNDVFKMFLYNMMAAEDSIFTPNDSLNFRYFEPCMQVSIAPYDTVTWPKTISLVLPSSGCICQDGNVRSGQIAITAHGSLQDAGSVFDLAISNYTVNNLAVTGYKKLTVTQSGSNGALLFNDSSVIQNALLSGNAAWYCEHTLQWILGFTTKSNIADDLFVYNGTSNSDDYSSLITDALQFQNYCFWIGSGKIEITPSSLSKRQVTYPDSCLNQADVIINNETFRVNF